MAGGAGSKGISPGTLTMFGLAINLITALVLIAVAWGAFKGDTGANIQSLQRQVDRLQRDLDRLGERLDGMERRDTR